MFGLTITIVSPRASRAKMVALDKMNLMFWPSTKRGWMAAVTATKTTSTAMMPNSRSLKTRSARRRELEPASPARARASAAGAAHDASIFGLPGGGGHDGLLRGVFVGELGHKTPFPHDKDAVGHAEHFRQLRGDHQDGHALVGESRPKAGAPRLGGDVDPRVGSSTIESRGRRLSHLARTTFCWLPPDKVETGFDKPPVLDAQPGRPVPAKRCSAARRTMPKRCRRSQRGKGDVALDGKLHDKALQAAVLGYKADPGGHGRRRATRLAAAPPTSPARRRSGRSRRWRGRPRSVPAPTSPARGDDLAAADLEGDVDEDTLAG